MFVLSFLRRTLPLLVLTAGIAFLPVANAQNAAYQTLEKTQPSEGSGKIEALEFFAYSCSHCNVIEPMVNQWEKTLPEDVTLQRVPVAFNANMTDLQKLYYTLENLNRLDLHEAVFKAIHTEKKQIFNEKSIVAWAVDQGLDKQTFSDVFNSFGIQSRVMRANELVKNYQIQGTPSVAIGGKYVTSPDQANGYEQTLKVADQLIEKARERGQP